MLDKPSPSQNKVPLSIDDNLSKELTSSIQKRLLEAIAGRQDHMCIPGMKQRNEADSIEKVHPELSNDSFQLKIIREMIERSQFLHTRQAELIHTKLYLEAIYASVTVDPDFSPDDLYCSMAFAALAKNSEGANKALRLIRQEYGQIDKDMYTRCLSLVKKAVESEGVEDFFEENESKFLVEAVKGFIRKFGMFDQGQVTKLVYVLSRHAEETNSFLSNEFVEKTTDLFLGISLPVEEVSNFIMEALFYSQKVNKFRLIDSATEDDIESLQIEEIQTAMSGLVFSYSYKESGKVSSEDAYDNFLRQIGSKCGDFFPRSYHEFLSDEFANTILEELQILLSEKYSLKSKENWNLASVLLYLYNYVSALRKLPRDYEIEKSGKRKVDITHEEINSRLLRGGNFHRLDGRDDIFYTKIGVRDNEYPIVVQIAKPKSVYSACEKIMRTLNSDKAGIATINDSNRLRVSLPYELRGNIDTSDLEDLCLAVTDTFCHVLKVDRRTIKNVKATIFDDTLTTNSFSLGVANFKLVFELDGSPIEMQIAFDFPDHNHDQYKHKQFKYNRPEDVRGEIFGSINYLYGKYCLGSTEEITKEDRLRYESICNVVNSFYIFPETRSKLNHIQAIFYPSMQVDFVGLSDPEEEDMAHLSQ